MGQRHQIFVVKKNNGYFNEDKTSKNYKNHVSKYGSKPTVIFPYHHQWLYGLTALNNCLNLLVTSQKINYDQYNKYGWVFDDLSKLYGNIQSLTKRDGKINFENVLFEGDEFPQMRFQYDIGDNNDGITIVFPEEKKYCFMFINEPYEDEDDRKPYIPLTAEQYLKCYYPDDYNTDKTLINTVKRFEKFSLMTKQEVRSYFPRMKKRPEMV